MESKSNRIAVLSAVLIAVFSSCEGEKDIVVPFSISTETIEAEAAETKVPITVTSPSPWKAECVDPWCVIVPSSGGPTSSVGTSVIITAVRNDGLERSCDVSIISDSGERAVVRVSQNHATKGLVLEKDQYKVGGETTHLEIPFHCDQPITAKSMDDWLELETITDNTLKLRFGEHLSLLSRTGIIRLGTNTGMSREIRVTQGDGFKDPALYDYLLSRYDADGDGILSKNDLSGLTSLTLDLSDMISPITELEGFECIPRLNSLYIYEPYYAFNTSRSLKINGHQSLTVLDFGVDSYYHSSISTIEITNCPQLQKVDFGLGFKLEKAVFKDNPGLQELTLVNPVSSDDVTLKDLVLEGCEGLRNIKIGNAHFEKEQNWGPLPQLRSLELRDFDGIQCLDLSQSAHLESVNLYFGTGSLKYMMIPKNLKTDFKTNVESDITIIYK